MLSSDANFRDVGTSLLAFGCAGIKPGTLLRSAEPPATIIEKARSVMNLRRCGTEVGCEREGVLYVPAPAPPRSEGDKYETREKYVRVWLREALLQVVSAEDALPLLIHCRAGRDRTGIVIAAILHICGIPHAAIKADFMLSPDAPSHLCDTMLAGLNGFTEELQKRKGFPLARLQNMFLAVES